MAPRSCVPSKNVNICTKAPYLTPRIWITCRDDDGCHNGFRWDATKLNCVDRDECADTPGICGPVAKCTNIPWSYACVCPDINHHYPGGAYPGTYTYIKQGDAMKCVDETASPKCEYGTFRYNGACVDDPCLDANFQSPCGANEDCTTAEDGSSYTCTCRNLVGAPCPAAAAAQSCTGTTAFSSTYYYKVAYNPAGGIAEFPNVEFTKYSTITFTALVGGPVMFFMAVPSKFGSVNGRCEMASYLTLYNYPFNEATPTTNAIIANGNFALCVSAFTANIVAGNKYVLVMTGVSSSDAGSYQIVSNPSPTTVGICV
ncbi:hypothetical protein HXX76_014918 [Chlamydomonas incerta]|uniref:EGF-like domain-containing protein n=1 Tax=Chlamydomonas incerta TaxID=51695 RepID=A0A835SKF5_CHLIN|nr:hypothetical protein HXX76_014918 [Chlamydomonas incerta]|eukprot:KAG2423979.1 hypothetical protein HXX76_014918 [Chlamydomonas incerta]